MGLHAGDSGDSGRRFLTWSQFQEGNAFWLRITIFGLALTIYSLADLIASGPAGTAWDSAMLAVGVAVLALTFFLFWTKRSTGRPRRQR